MSEPTELIGLLREVVQAIERSTAELRKLEATIERQQKSGDKTMAEIQAEIKAQAKVTSDEVRRLTEQVNQVTSLWAANQKAEKVAQERRAQAIQALWKAPGFQLLFIGLVVVFLQAVGVSWVVSHYLPQIQISSGDNSK